MEKCTFDRRPEKNKLLNNCLRQITAKARENGGLNIVQNWREMRDKECIFLISCITTDRASLMTAPVTGDIVCVSWIRMVDTLNALQVFHQLPVL